MTVHVQTAGVPIYVPAHKRGVGGILSFGWFLIYEYRI